MNSTETNLDPWRILLSHLMEIDSYHIPNIIDKTGMSVEWTLTEKENHSNKYRKDAFRPRIIAAYQLLSQSDQLRVSYTISEELRNIVGSTAGINSDLERIGWRIEKNGLIPIKADVKELFFPKNTQHDAYVIIREIIQGTKHSIAVIDPYVDSSIFTMFDTISTQNILVKILTFKVPNDFHLETKKFLLQNKYYKVEIRNTKEFHDRFIVIDESKYWHIGCSIKDAGNKAFMISKIEDISNINALKMQIKKTWEAAHNVDL